jgi:hypothetical protein
MRNGVLKHSVPTAFYRSTPMFKVLGFANDAGGRSLQPMPAIFR